MHRFRFLFSGFIALFFFFISILMTTTLSSMSLLYNPINTVAGQRRSPSASKIENRKDPPTLPIPWHPKLSLLLPSPRPSKFSGRLMANYATTRLSFV
ncbi:unnamed protein product [Microthlaspi erraticum]|uniref:Uncharacterized protein n=1 Tax=Microthlaspi erraticum TaxID=1685480 RepID=A0A6D2KIG0_9BRAS|nr:unnamed protein product [Microthlaspi erraticum]